jgi:hypothetical protein
MEGILAGAHPIGLDPVQPRLRILRVPSEDTQPKDDHAVPPLKERLLGVLLEPIETFRRLESGWGLAGPILLVAAAGLLAGVLYLALVDVTALSRAQTAYSTELLPEQTRRMMQQAQGGNSGDVTAGRGGAFMLKVGLFAGPTVGTILSVVLGGLLLFGVAFVAGGKRDLLQAMVVAAHAKLVTLVGTGAFAIGTLLGNPQAQTSPVNLVDLFAHPTLAGILGGLDPISIWHTALLSIGLAVSLGVARSRAIAFGVTIYAIPWLLGIAATLVFSALMGGMAGK